MQKRTITTLLLSGMGLALAPVAHAQDPYIPFFRSISGFGRDTVADGIPSYSIPAEDIDYRDTPIPQNTRIAFTGKDYDGARVSANLFSNDFGFFAAKNHAELGVTNVQNHGYYALAGRGSHTTVEFFTPGALAERAVFRWRVTGLSSTTVGIANSRIDFAAGSYATTNFNSFFDIPEGERLVGLGPGTYTYTLPMTLDQPIDLFYWSSAYIEVKDSETTALVGQSFSALADFSSTYILDKIDLFDGSNNLLNNWTMREVSSGTVMFDQNGRTINAGVTSAPEPASLLLLSLGGVIALRRRRV